MIPLSHMAMTAALTLALTTGPLTVAVQASAQTAAPASTAPASVPLSPDDEKLFEAYLQNVADFSMSASQAYIDAVAADEAHDPVKACASARQSLDYYVRDKANIDNMINQVKAIGDTSDAENEAVSAASMQKNVDSARALVARVCPAG